MIFVGTPKRLEGSDGSPGRCLDTSCSAVDETSFQKARGDTSAVTHLPASTLDQSAFSSACRYRDNPGMLNERVCSAVKFPAIGSPELTTS